jgi:hypothetical protein
MLENLPDVSSAPNTSYASSPRPISVGGASLAALLRRENLYSNQLQAWRKQLAQGAEKRCDLLFPGVELN